MTTKAPEKAENEAARNWGAGLLAGAGSRIDGDMAKRWTDICVGILLSVHRDEKISYEEKVKRCDEAYAVGLASSADEYPTKCVVDGEEYIFCHDCPLWVG